MTRRTKLTALYHQRVASGELRRSADQEQALERLDAVLGALREWSGRSKGFFSRFRRSEPEAQPRGLYMWGGVGRGKTMLMDLFFAAAPVALKRRAHFHEFMAEVHAGIGEARRRDPGDPIPIVAAEIKSQADLLCFDELHVTDIADAMILGRLFRALFGLGVVVVATSNVPPRDLYKDGLNRSLFLPFVALIEKHMEVFDFGGDVDFRLEKLAGRSLYFSPLGDSADVGLDQLWREFSGGRKAQPGTIKVLGRDVPVPAMIDGVARFSFADLCDAPLGPRDFLAIARQFHTLFIERIPVMTPARRNSARRFINLIDTLYDNRVCLVASAEAEPDLLYPAGDGADHFARTASRLIEMRSQYYLEDRRSRITDGSAPDPVNAQSATE